MFFLHLLLLLLKLVQDYILNLHQVLDLFDENRRIHQNHRIRPMSFGKAPQRPSEASHFAIESTGRRRGQAAAGTAEPGRTPMGPGGAAGPPKALLRTPRRSYRPASRLRRESPRNSLLPGRSCALLLPGAGPGPFFDDTGRPGSGGGKPPGFDTGT